MWQTQTVKNRNQITTTGIILAANADRIGFLIQNLSTNVAYVKFDSTVTSSVYDYALNGCTTTADGKGGVLSMLGGVVETGNIAITGILPNYTAWEI
jgi:hypothetical protein